MHVDNVSTGLPKLICLLLIVLYTLPAPTPSTVEIIFKLYIIITPYFSLLLQFMQYTKNRFIRLCMRY